MEISNPKPETRNPKPKTRNLKLNLSSWLLTFGLLVAGVGGAFLPWIWRESVALQLTAPGLAEFVKFLPEIRTAQLDVERLYFLLPLFVAMLTLPLFVSNQRLALPAWWRWLIRLAVIPLALASLSPVWTPAILMSPEFRLQTMLAAVAIGLSIIAPLLKNLSLKPLVAFLIIGGGVAIALPLWQFSLIQNSIEEAYHQPIRLGWGWWLNVVGILMSLTGGMGAVFMTRKQ